MIEVKKSVILLFAFLCTILSGCIPPRHYSADFSKQRVSSIGIVKVLIGKTEGKIILSSEKGITAFDSHNKVYYRGKNITVSAEDVNLKIKIESPDGIISVDNVQYRGFIVLSKVQNNLQIINHVNIENYLCGVVPMEMSKSWPLEALKAQAIAARSYAYNHILNNKNTVFDLDSTTKFQVYGGFNAESEISNKAVRDTAGVVMISKDKPIAAFFHSTCGGETISNQYVWKGENSEYLTDVKCTYCSDSPHFTWHEEMSINEFSSVLRKNDSAAGALKGITFKKHNGRVTECILNHSSGVISVSGNDLRLLLGAKKIKSWYFTTSKVNNVIRIDGRGYGHGVGMCQYGARGMALKGLDHVEILRKYYRGIEFLRI